MGKDVTLNFFLFALDCLYVSEHAVLLEPFGKLGFKSKKSSFNRVENGEEMGDKQTKTDGIAVQAG